IVVADGIIDVGGESKHPTLRAALEANALDDIAREAKAAKSSLALSQVALLPPIPVPDKIVCVGLNYRAHAEEAGRKLPEHPSLFIRLANTLVPHGGAMS